MFDHRFYTVTLLGQIKCFCLFFGHPGGQIGVTKGQILPIPLKTTSGSWKCAQRANFL